MLQNRVFVVNCDVCSSSTRVSTRVYASVNYHDQQSCKLNTLALCPLLILLLLVIVQPYKQQFALHYKTNSAFIILYAGICTVLLVFVNGKLQYLEFFGSAVYFFSILDYHSSFWGLCCFQDAGVVA